MDNWDWINTVAPDFWQEIQQRYRILQRIHWMQPIGRRVLAAELDLSERVLRRETDLFRQTGLIEMSKSGMLLTELGVQVTQQLDHLLRNVNDNSMMGEQLAKHLGIKQAIIVPGNSERHAKVLDLMGRELNRLLNQCLPPGCNTVAVMGGTTMAAVAQQLLPSLTQNRQLLFVPARGGLGESVAIQANTVCAEMAAHSGGRYRALYVPEDISSQSVKPLLKEPVVKAVLDLINQANVVINGIGRAQVMAQRRHMSSAEIQYLEEKKAVSEAFGNFLNAAGEVVYRVPKIGLQVSDLINISYVITIAGGPQKVQAIESYMKIAPQQTILITDEAAAKLILRGQEPLK
ncbi:Glycolytic regulator [Bombilactobacillus mellifer]|uniref:Glycolytic regulator n=1 Tax=Bombilactobacillus mellifer TaxID=1218492 RepID=A0A0F4LXL5_9LACO|nr:sugar-binding domain-containing protein [Bombilactobacillus mellifer]KJY62311.1 Glycolytic regulator [Bombilactobacillus mellifer]